MNSIALTLNQYLDNPTMMNKSSVMNLSLVRQALDDRYDILMSKHKKIKHEIYAKDNNFLIHFHLPSESYDLNYDVLILVETDSENKDTKDSKDLVKNKFFKVFSNCPSFAFTYGYVFNLYDLIIPSFKNKLTDDILKKAPIKRNALRMISYDKSLYYCILFLLSEYPYISNLVDKSKDLDMKVLKDKVKSIDDKISEYNRKKKAYQRLKKKDVGIAMKEAIKKDLKKKGIVPKPSSSKSKLAKSKIAAQPKITGKRSSSKTKRKITGKRKK